MRLGLFGGTFDPVHLGHLLLAEQCRAQCELDQVWFLPSGNPPHKADWTISPAQARVEMLELAIAGHPAFSVSRLEVDRSGITYTVDTLQQLHDEDPDRELFFLIGADSLADLPKWRQPDRIIQLATVVAVNRGDRPLPELNLLAERLGNAAVSRIRIISMPGVDISSTEIRRCLLAGRTIRYLTPRAVEMYLHEHQIYKN